MSLYRDPLAGLKSQVAQKRGLVELRERELAPLIRAMLPARLRTVLDGRRVSSSPESGEDLEALTRDDAELDAVLAAYDEALAMAPKLRECPLDVDDPPKPHVAPPWLIEEERQRVFRKTYEARVKEVCGADGYLVRWGDVTYLVRFRAAGAPLIATTWGNFQEAAVATTFASALRTSVPRVAPQLRVKKQATLDGIAKALRLARDDETGDRGFDETFMVDGRDGGVLLLTRDVTGAMQKLAPWSPSLTVANGIAEVAWEGMFRNLGGELLHDAAFEIVLGVRAAIERA